MISLASRAAPVEAPSVAVTFTPAAASAASATVAVLVALAVLPPISVIATPTVYLPSSAYVWPPFTENEPFAPLTVPVELVPSSQSIVAVKPLARSVLLLSVKVATVVLLARATPSVAAVRTACAASVTAGVVFSVMSVPGPAPPLSAARWKKSSAP
jgi:hypothetical protein